MGAFGYRLNGVAAHLDTGIDYSQGSRYVASGTFDFKPTDRLTITADVEYFEKSIVEPALFLLTIPSGATSVNISDVNLLDPSVNHAAADLVFNRAQALNPPGKDGYNHHD